MSGRISERVSVVMANPRSVPALMYEIEAGIGMKIT